MNSTNHDTPAIGARVVTLLVFVISLWPRDADVLVGLSGADGLNLVLAKALAGGDGLRFVHMPEAPIAVGFPPLHPFLVGMAWRAWPAFPENLTLFRLLSAAVLAGAAWLVIAHAIRLAVPRLAVYASTLLGFSYVPLLSVGVLLSEEPLLLLVAAVALWFADRRDDRKSSAFLAGTFAGLAALAAQWGVIMIPAVAIGFATRRQWQSSGVCFGVALLVVLVGRMVFWGAVVGWAGSEIAVTDLATVSGLQSDATVTSQLFNALPGRSVFLAVVPAVALAVWGAVSIAREAPTLVSVFALVVAGIPLGFHAIQWVAIPWFFLLCAIGAVRLGESSPRFRMPGAVLVSLVGIVYLWGALSTRPGTAFLQELSDQSAAYSKVVSSIAAETPETAVIASRHDALVFLYTGRRTLRFRESQPTAEDADARIRLLCNRGATHVLADSRWPETGNAGSGFAVAMFRLTDGFGLYRIECPDSAEDDGDAI